MNGKMVNVTTDDRQCRVVALALRPRQFGYAVLEGPVGLLDWDVRIYAFKRSESISEAVTKRITPLLKFSAPSRVIIKDDADWTPQRRKELAPVVLAVKTVATQLNISVEKISTEIVERAFAHLPGTSKHLVASAVAIRFPELAWILPPPRKPWVHEHFRMPIFDAVALGLAFFHQE